MVLWIGTLTTVSWRGSTTSEEIDMYDEISTRAEDIETLLESIMLPSPILLLIFC
jgi:hypothetical protein